MNIFNIPARAIGKVVDRETAVGMAVLNLAYDNGGEIGFDQLWKALPCTRREIWKACRTEAGLGNLKRHRVGEPITLTASARSAIRAGRELSLQLQREAA
jgi:hypothetical protein